MPPPPQAPLNVVVGPGGVGGALAEALEARGEPVLRLGRRTDPPLDLLDEPSIIAAARHIAEGGRPLGRLLIAAGLLAYPDAGPERSLAELDPARLRQAFAVNAIGPALVLKHFTPLLPREAPATLAALSARVGSIGDNRLGGWHGYRASKAALNQLVRTAALELARTRPRAVVVVLHPGTVDTPLSRPFRKAGLDLQTPAEAAARLLAVLDALTPADTGRFLDHHGVDVPW